jgi:hypothetical protein
VTVTPVNDPPVAVNDFTNTVEDVSVTIHPLVNDSDVDGDPLIIISVSPTNGTASISGTKVVFTPATNFNGTATIGYTISDIGIPLRAHLADYRFQTPNLSLFWVWVTLLSVMLCILAQRAKLIALNSFVLIIE